MDPRKLRLGFLFAAGAIVLALLLPSGPRSASLLPWPAIWQTTAGAGLLFLCAAWMANARATAFGLAGAALAGGATLAMLRDPAVAGSAACALERRPSVRPAAKAKVYFIKNSKS